jgi:hypothetical protein
MVHNDPSIVVQGLPMSDVGYINIDAIERARNTITFCAGNPNTEMLKVSQEGFWVRGVKVTQDDKEAEIVYNAFKAWMMWAKLNER